MSSGITPVAAPKATRPEPAGKLMPIGKRVRVAAGAHGVGQQQAVEPAVDHAVARAQGHAAAVADELGQLAVRLHVHRLGVGGGVAEGLHHHVGAEAQAGQVLQLVAGHGAGGVLAAHGGHLGLAVGAGAHALAFRQAAGAADHLLRQREAGLGFGGRCGRRKAVEAGRPRNSRALAVSAADDQVDAAAGLHFVQQHVALEQLGNRGAVLLDLACVGVDVDDVAHLHLGDVHLDRQRARVFLRVEEDGAILPPSVTPPKRLLGTKGMSLPVAQMTELVADLRLEPVPTTSPT
jgi:hypothetical protein